jgi:hypothetical protein
MMIRCTYLGGLGLIRGAGAGTRRRDRGGAEAAHCALHRHERRDLRAAQGRSESLSAKRPLDLPRRKANGLAVIVALGKIGCHAVQRFDTA